MAKRTLVGRSDAVLAYRGRGKRPSPRLRIFLNYRREETSGHAGRLYDELVERFGEDQVFMDVDTIEPGADFTAAVKDAVGACDAFVAVIGRQWLHVKDTRDRRRLDNPEDFVRLEIEAALDRNVRVIPALVQDAEMPSSDELPESLAALARRNALNFSDDRWRYDVGRLVAALERLERDKKERASRERREAAQRPAAAKDSPGREATRSPGPPSRRQRHRASTESAPIARWRRLPKGLVFAVAAVALAGVGAALAQGLVGSTEPAPAAPKAAAIRVPKLVGASQSQAVSALRRLGLRVNVVRVRGAGQKGRVLAQVPAQGRLIKRGSAVQLKVAAGPKPKPAPPLVTVPRFQRAPGPLLVSRFRQQGLRIRIERVFSARREGWVLAQVPRAGKRVRKGASIRLRVSAGSRPQAPPTAPPTVQPPSPPPSAVTPTPTPTPTPPPTPPPAPPPPPPPTITGGGSD